MTTSHLASGLDHLQGEPRPRWRKAAPLLVGAVLFGPATAGSALAQERGLHGLFSSLERMFDPEPAPHLSAHHGMRRGAEPMIVAEPRRLSAERGPEQRRAP